MNIRYFVGSVLLTIIIIPSPAIGGDDTMLKFELLDNDGDGFISQSEATQNYRLRESWNNIDKDHDGRLTAKEFSAFATAPKEVYSDQ